MVKQWSVVVLTATLFVASASWFCIHYQVWLDETTQLSGLTLSPVEVVSWLSGEDPSRFGVPPDRQPPLSYWVMMPVHELTGGSTLALRLLGLSLTLVGALAIIHASMRCFGVGGLAGTSLLLLLSPSLIWHSVMIRPYPLFFALGSAAVATTLIGTHEERARERTRWLALTTLAIALASWTHFFGVVVGASCLAAWVVVSLRRRMSLHPILIAAGVVGLASSLLVPFVLASASMSSPSTHHSYSNVVVRLLRLTYRLFSHASTATWPPLALMLLGAIGCLAAMALFRLVAAVRSGGDDCLVSLGAILGVGLALPLVASFVVGTFDSLAPHYNLWLTGPASMFVTAGIEKVPYRWRQGFLGAIGASNMGAIVALSMSPSCFTFGQSEILFDVVERHRPAAVLHEGEAWAFAYFVLRFDAGTGLRQWVRGDDGLLRSADDLEPVERSLDALGGKLVIVRSEYWTSPDVAACARSGATPSAPDSSDALLRDWRVVERVGAGAFVAMSAVVLEAPSFTEYDGDVPGEVPPAPEEPPTRSVPPNL